MIQIFIFKNKSSRKSRIKLRHHYLAEMIWFCYEPDWMIRLLMHFAIPHHLFLACQMCVRCLINIAHQELSLFVEHICMSAIQWHWSNCVSNSDQEFSMWDSSKPLWIAKIKKKRWSYVSNEALQSMQVAESWAFHWSSRSHVANLCTATKFTTKC